ncbi:MAG: para-aminobenzoate synthetase / 4-amino-4-deoxychorismate lyase [Pseudonocardiales bacterium]|nr:para-aminobenzoate synthetase / 4-amino-4-deoxychorismate lyase [Pseudonocardiales bacterium]
MTDPAGPYDVRRVGLGPGPAAEELVRRAAGWPGLICLRGAWAGGCALLTSHPERMLPAGADPLAAFAGLPQVSAGDGVVAGGWFGRIAFDGPSQLGFYDSVLRLVDGQWWFESLWRPERGAALAERLAAWQQLLGADARPAATWSAGEFDGPPTDDHLAAVERAIELIRAGELYQVNVCTRLGASFAGSSAALFAAAVDALDPRFGAYLAGDVDVVSLSPELFVQRRGRDVLSAPIKGTLPRSAGDDNAAALRRSTKDAAENVMIVDLVRNDLGRVCVTGTVRPAVLLEVQPHPGVWHLVSSVRGVLRPDVDDADLLTATFPPGSVTGAPKLRAVRAIGELEAAPRRTYTGAIGFVSPVWGAQFSVAIRTFEISAGRIELGVGGGVTADSVPMLEWRECLHKAAPLLHAAGAAPLRVDPPAASPASRAAGVFETLLGLDGVPVRLADHLARLDRSCRELFGHGLPADVAGRVLGAAKGVPVGRALLRVAVSAGLEIEVTAAPAPPPAGPMNARSRVRPGGLWRHKWTDRRWASEPGLFLAPDGTVLETERGNVFLVEPDGTLVTPPLRDDVLPGVTRRALLDLARDEGRPAVLRCFPVGELVSRPAFWTSSLSGAVPIHAVDGVQLPRADELVTRLATALTSGERTVR